MEWPSDRERRHDLEYSTILQGNIDQSSEHRIALRHRKEDTIALENKDKIENLLNKIVSRRGISTAERNVLGPWAKELLELLSRPSTDPGYIFYKQPNFGWMLEKVTDLQMRLPWDILESVPGTNPKQFRVKDEYSPGKLALSFVIGSPEESRSTTLEHLSQKVVKRYESQDKARGQKAAKALKKITKQIREMDVRFTFRDRDNWAKIYDKFWVIINTPIERLNANPQLYDILMDGYDVRTFIATLNLTMSSHPDEDLPEPLGDLPPRPSPAGGRRWNPFKKHDTSSQRSLDHRRITSRYSSIAQVPVYGPARFGGVHF